MPFHYELCIVNDWKSPLLIADPAIYHSPYQPNNPYSYKTIILFFTLKIVCYG